MRSGAMCWQQQGERTWVMELADGGEDWIEVKSRGEVAGPTWRVDARLNGNHYRMSDAFPTKEAAQGCALLLAMRQLPASRDPAKVIPACVTAAQPATADAATGWLWLASPSTTRTSWVPPSSTSAIARGSTATPSSRATAIPRQRRSGFVTEIS
jgi:hypothetical protein